MPDNPQTPPSVRERLLKDILIHEPECAFSMYGTACDCVQLNVADAIMSLVEETETKAWIAALQWALSDYNMPDTNTRKNLEEFIEEQRQRLATAVGKESDD